MKNDNFKLFEMGFSLTLILALLIAMPIVTVFFTDYYQIMNLKEEVDNTVKRTIVETMELQIDDEDSSNRVIAFNEDKLKADIVQLSEEKLKAQGIRFEFEQPPQIEKTDKFYFYWDGIVKYHPMLSNIRIFPDNFSFPDFIIKVRGRSKVQRFDWEDRNDGSVITQP